MKLNEVLPVLISVTILIFVAIVQKQSKTIAAITATMPVTITLTLWVVYSSTQGEHVVMEKFTKGLIAGIIPTLAYTVALWVGARLGLKLGWMIVAGYATWAATSMLIFLLKRMIGYSDI